MLEAALLAEDYCCAIDINLGCPQAIAKRGNYGAFLQDKWELLYDIVHTLSKGVKVPITCKIRVFDDLEKTLQYAKMLESAGCAMLTVHGRTKEQKGPLTGTANWNYVKAVRQVVNIPVISNGNIQCLQDVQLCLEETKVQGIMTAEGNLYNPAIFMGVNPPAWEPAIEYLELVDKYPCPTSYVRGHLFKLFHHVLSIPSNNSLRMDLGAANTHDDFKRIVYCLMNMYVNYHEGLKKWEHTTAEGTQNLVLPPWLCQPYVRNPPEEHIKKTTEAESCVENKRQYEDSDGNPISRKRMKKLRRIARRPEKSESVQTHRSLEKCQLCVNPLGTKCEYKLCKKCCRDKCFIENLNCEGHRILVKARREMAQFYSKKRREEQILTCAS
ncbi:hypothetical protein FQA39_LY01799 [Lamprigera yunnana]|nr:hypothetical protein FQA39_LY01799 [Lamprigera yunnana]